MLNLISIIEKNLKISARSKVSTFAILLAPILIVLLIGTAFGSDSLSNIKLGVYSESYSSVTNSILDSLDKDGFQINKLESNDSCMESVKQGNNHICIIFPKDLSISGNSESVIFHVDNSRVNIAYSLIDKVNSKISIKSSELGLAMANDLINALKQAKSVVNAQEKEIEKSLGYTNQISSDSDKTATLVSSVNSALERLNKIKSESASTNDSSISGYAQTAINSLESITNNQTGLSANIKKIKSGSNNASESLASISAKLDALIIELDKIKIENAESVVSPIKINVNTLSKDSTNWNYLFPTLVALIILLSSLILSSSLVLAEKRARAHFRNFLTPTSDFVFILGIYLTCLLIMIVQLSILFVGTIYLTEFNLIDVIPQIILVVVLSSSVFIFLGMFIGYLFKSEEPSLLATISLAAILMFFSNVIFPSESIASNFRNLAIFNPFYISDLLLKKIIIFQAEIPEFQTDLYILIGMLAVGMLITYIARKATKRTV